MQRPSKLRPQPALLGRVSLVGAGPGDPELLTLKALDRIRTAQAVVHDALISAEILALFSEDCAIHDVGKRSSNHHSSDQDEIRALLVRLARNGLQVVRLKGGDPFIFGRGGEEAAYLETHGIPWEVVPAVSALNGAGSSAAIPLTHRGVSQSFTVLEGHEAGLSRIGWDALVRLGGTWVFYMAKSTVGAIARNLLRHGASADLPLAVVENATLPNQAVTILSLEKAAQRGFVPVTAGPGIVIVSRTVDVLPHAITTLHTWVDHGFPLSAVPELGT
ncbi:MAG TPA: uroporphyrinogen-III C-methyltransferase [bacterium]